MERYLDIKVSRRLISPFSHSMATALLYRPKSLLMARLPQAGADDDLHRKKGLHTHLSQIQMEQSNLGVALILALENAGRPEYPVREKIDKAESLCR